MDLVAKEVAFDVCTKWANYILVTSRSWSCHGVEVIK